MKNKHVVFYFRMGKSSNLYAPDVEQFRVVEVRDSKIGYTGKLKYLIQVRRSALTFTWWKTIDTQWFYNETEAVNSVEKIVKDLTGVAEVEEIPDENL